MDGRIAALGSSENASSYASTPARAGGRAGLFHVIAKPGAPDAEQVHYAGPTTPRAG
ncbi:MAG TPA: hypothetical protein H9665_00400 [Firmicutes bacterium]|nr:hypothetical protein [Bacillota bacterium]